MKLKNICIRVFIEMYFFFFFQIKLINQTSKDIFLKNLENTSLFLLNAKSHMYIHYEVFETNCISSNKGSSKNFKNSK